MGNFYTNITVKGPSQQDLADFIQTQGRTAYVSNTIRGYTVIFDEKREEQDTRVLAELAAQLSSKLRCAALSVLNHDDDVLMYQLYENGKLLDNYDSCPDYFNTRAKSPRPPQGGDLKKLADTFGVEYPVDEATSILRRDDYAFAVDRHEELARTLGMPDFVAGLGYHYLEQIMNEDEVFSEELDISLCKKIGS
jgi:hypothetical protein